MANSESFLTIFSTIESWLRKEVGADRRTSFYKLVDLAAESNKSTRRFRDDLKEFADLRNAIVHERSDEHVIAEPNDRVVRDFQRIQSALLNPPKVIPQFQLDVRCRESSESVGIAVTDMRDGSFSQIPILADARVIAVLTSETIVRWMASEVENQILDPWETCIAQALEHTEDRENYCLLSRNATLIDALSKFEDFAARGKNLDAILISNDGKPDQKLLGILTIFNFPDLLDTIGLKKMNAV